MQAGIKPGPQLPPCQPVPDPFSGDMSRHERVVIELAVAILRKGVEESGKAKVDTIAVRLALRCLLPHCRETWPLVSYWDGAGGDNEIGRAQTVTAAFNGIVRQLRASGAWRD